VKKNSSTSVFLTGGLGNQIFQLAVALSRGERVIQLDSSLGKPRTNQLGKPDLSDFKLPSQVIWDNRKKYNRFVSRIAGYVLRQGMSPKGIEKFDFFRVPILLCASVVFSIREKRFVRVIQSTDNGFCDLPTTKGGEYLIGYFQSYRWASYSSVVGQIHGLCLIRRSKSFEKFQASHKSKNLGIVHVRLGDYKNEASFGIPDKNYYKTSLDILYNSIRFDRLLVFSNEPDEALNYIPNEYLDCSEIVPDFDGSAAETLEAMRLGNGFVIGNSSLSWWGAFLRYDRKAPVIAPDPWFRFSPDPTDLIPLQWIKVSAWSEDLGVDSSTGLN
jgi:hypothetical protein